MITDQQALLIMGEILAGFLKEHLPQQNRWRDHIAPELRGQPDMRERPLEQLDLSALLQVFMGAKELFYQTKVFRTGLPFQLALCVRGMRNFRAHDTYASVLTEDERLFDLHALRRFAMVVDNRAAAPGLIEKFLTAVDARILESTQRCLGATAPPAQATPPPAPASTPLQFDELLQVSARTQEEMAQVHERLKEVADRLAEVTQGAGGSATSEPAAQEDAGPSVQERLTTIEWKLDQVLARGVAAPTELAAEEALGEPENLSLLEAKAALRRLRAHLADTYPDVDPVRQLLRQSMVDMILQRRVADLDAFAEQIPEVMRRDTDQRQLDALPQVFEVVSRLRLDPPKTPAPADAEIH
jgi:hypothetical protein